MLGIADGALDPSSRREMWLVTPVAIKRDVDVPLSPDDEPLPVAAELEVAEAPHLLALVWCTTFAPTPWLQSFGCDHS